MVPQNGRFIMENPRKMDELGVPHFRTPMDLFRSFKSSQLPSVPRAPRALSRCVSQGPQGPVAAALKGAEGRSTAVGRVVAGAPRGKFGHGKGESSMTIDHFDI